MKKKILIITLFLFFFLGSFTSCKKEINDKLIGNWVNEQRDTLAFLSHSVAHLNPFYLNLLTPHSCFKYWIEEDYIVLKVNNFSSSIIPISYPFIYSKKQIEIVGFYQNPKDNIFKRVK